MGSAIGGAAAAVGERDVGVSGVGAVEHNHRVVRQQLHVHCGDSDTFAEELPPPAAVLRGERRPMRRGNSSLKNAKPMRK